MIIGARTTYVRSQHKIDGDKYLVTMTVEHLHPTKGWKKVVQRRGTVPSGGLMPLRYQKFQNFNRASNVRMPPRPPLSKEARHKSLMRHGWYRRATRKQASNAS